MENYENQGYLRFPTIANDYVVFVAENDLWSVSVSGGKVQRLTNTPGVIHNPHLSEDGKWIAYSSADDGNMDVYVMPAQGGYAKRITYHPNGCIVVGWHPNNKDVLFKSCMEGTTAKQFSIYMISKEGGSWEKLPIGPANTARIAFDEELCVLQRGYVDSATWKGYKGGRLGQIWYGNIKEGNFACLSKPDHADTLPFFHGDRIFFLSDRENCCNLYSFEVDGSDVQQHTFHKDFYARWVNYHDSKAIYQKAGELWLFDIAAKENRKLDIKLPSCGVTLRSRFVSCERFLDEYCLSPDEKKMVVVSRGNMYLMNNWYGATRQIGLKARYKHVAWLHCSKKLIAVNDASGEEEVLVYCAKTGKELKKFSKIRKGGYIQQLLPSPKEDVVAVSIQSELCLLHLETEEIVFIDKANHRYFRDFSWSCDGKWLAYAKYEGDFASIYLYSVEEKKATLITPPNAHDFSPRFDPKGKYLFFLSKRAFNPYADSFQIEYNFPASVKPYFIVLSEDEYSPLSPMAKFKQEEEQDKEEQDKEQDKEEQDKEEDKEKKIQVDLEGIAKRVQEIPVKEGRYLTLIATKNKVIMLKKPTMGRLREPSIWEDSNQPRNQLLAYDFCERKEETLIDKLTSFSYLPFCSKMIVQIRKKLRVVKVGEVIKNSDDKPGEKSGWLDLSRVKVQITPKEEWLQMYRENWRWQRDFFWRQDMGGIDWQKVYDDYLPVLKNIRTRSELTDLLWEVNGELRTSHAYVLLGETPTTPRNKVGLLGADLELDSQSQLYRFAKIYEGDIAHNEKHSPLLEPGLKVNVGDYLLEINGQAISDHPYKYLTNLSKHEVILKISTTSSEEDAREIVVKTLFSELPLRYRQWLDENRKQVEQKTNGRVGYLHIPDMGVSGLINFHRDFLWQYNKDGLLVDVRNNGGGHVSPMFLAKLQRKVLGYCQPRLGEPEVYPEQTMRGPIVILCDENTGSDGDIFCRAAKSMGLGVLIGKRTWGGVVGIMADKRLVDGGIVTQPEFAFWFKDQGWGVENGGVEPDIEIDNDPASVAKGEDRQLEHAIEEILKQLEKLDLSLPKLE